MSGNAPKPARDARRGPQGEAAFFREYFGAFVRYGLYGRPMVIEATCWRNRSFDALFLDTGERQNVDAEFVRRYCYVRRIPLREQIARRLSIQCRAGLRCAWWPPRKCR